MGIRYEERNLTTTQKVVVGGECDQCGAELEQVFPNSSHAQFEGASVIVMHGYYGGFIDPVTMPDPEWILCEECSERLWNTLGPKEYYR